MSDSADELRGRENGFEAFEDVDGRRGELALVSWRVYDAAPSNPCMADSSSWVTLSASSLALATDSVADAGAVFAD